MLDQIELKDDIIINALKNINFDGWSKKSILTGFNSQNKDEEMYNELFPNGIIDAIIHFADIADRQMLQGHLREDFKDQRIPEKIKNLLMSRFEFLNPYKEAVRKSVAILALPSNSKIAIKSLYNTTDKIWSAVGDQSTDISFYTKRASLAGVYSSTLMSWLGSTDPELQKVDEFIDRRLNNINVIGKITKPFKENLNFTFDQLNKFPFFNFNR
tara:strand:- start:186 stop:827 length:642 start_codon:yes stop_codon:yes gene_type:complete